jgi:hypothetical protein
MFRPYYLVSSPPLLKETRPSRPSKEPNATKLPVESAADFGA